MSANSNVYFRVIGNSIGLALHTGNAVVLHFTMQGDILKDPDIRTLKATQLKFVTIWNMGFQMIFLFLSLLCDVQLILKKKNVPKYVKHIRAYNDIIFSAIVWPLTVIVFTVFWPFFIINRELIFPAFIDKAISLTSNHIMHTSILPIVLIEMFCHPRSRPKSHKWYLAHAVFIFVSYFAVILYNYSNTGTFPYPFVLMLYGTVYFPLFVLATSIIYLILYFTQWTINDLVHKRNKSKIR
ncbi:androgen-dependent TFPI-regulating protein-like [Melitaea cinxia]|uniref:androgen-dependent TFPI-regulating protein-like n=1 Tax=Melitaea cinxia TaxID=113334 RepID=UPI001E271446|nr:androgen-dependent TFPI-regulating protein-like [Melitaea cinxia]